jgi:hypothetical protein
MKTSHKSDELKKKKKKRGGPQIGYLCLKPLNDKPYTGKFLGWSLSK